MVDFKGKKGLILGVGNQFSIAWAIAEQLSEQGAELGLTYLKDPKGRFEKNVRKLGTKLGATFIHECDVASDESIDELASKLKEEWGGLDFLVHSLAYASHEDLNCPFSETRREGFRLATEISAYSLLPLASKFAPMMKEQGGGSIITLTFVGSSLAVPNYNVMGVAKAALESSVRYLARELGPEAIRVNAISAGAIRTLSSSGVKNFAEMLRIAREHSALERTVTQKEVGNTAAFLCSDAASGITGQVIYVDAGYSVMAN